MKNFFQAFILLLIYTAVIAGAGGLLWIILMWTVEHGLVGVIIFGIVLFVLIAWVLSRDKTFFPDKIKED